MTSLECSRVGAGGDRASQASLHPAQPAPGTLQTKPIALTQPHPATVQRQGAPIGLPGFHPPHPATMPKLAEQAKALLQRTPHSATVQGRVASNCLRPALSLHVATMQHSTNASSGSSSSVSESHPSARSTFITSSFASERKDSVTTSRAPAGRIGFIPLIPNPDYKIRSRDAQVVEWVQNKYHLEAVTSLFSRDWMMRVTPRATASP